MEQRLRPLKILRLVMAEAASDGVFFLADEAFSHISNVNINDNDKTIVIILILIILLLVCHGYDNNIMIILFEQIVFCVLRKIVFGRTRSVQF